MTTDTENYWDRKNLSRRNMLRGTMATAVGAGALALAGCGDDSADTSGVGSTGTAASTEATPAPKQGGSVTFTWTTPWDTWDHALAGVPVQFMLTGTHNRLLSWKHGGDTFQMDYTPVTDDGLAQAFEQPDPMTFTFALRPGIKFADKAPVSGAQFTARDVVHTFKRLAAAGRDTVISPLVDSVTAIDDTHVQFKLKQVYAPFIQMIAHTMFTIQSEKQTDYGKADQNVGTGPFVFDSVQDGVQWTIKRKPDYWNQPFPYLDSLTYKPILDDNTIYAQARAGTMDWPQHFFKGIPPSIAKELQSSNKNLVSRPWEMTSPQFISYRVDEPPFNDLRVRQAMSLAFDRDQYIDLILEGKGRPTGGATYEFTKPWYVEWDQLGESSKYLKMDLAEAKKLMAAAGVGNGFEMTFYPSSAELQGAYRETDLFQGMFAKIGVKLNSQYLPQAQLTSMLGTAGKPNYHAVLYPTHGFNCDPDPILYSTFIRTNVMNHSDAKLKGFLDKQRGTLVKEERIQALHDYQVYQAEQAYAIYQPIGQQVMLSPKDIRNFGPHNSFDTGMSASKVWRA